VPTAVELSGPRDQVRVTVLVEGVEAGVAARGDTLLALLGAGATADDTVPEGLGALPFTPGGTGLKITSSLTGVGPALAAAHRTTGELGLELQAAGSAAGVLHAGLDADADPAAVAALVEVLRVATATYDGTVTVLTAPAAVRDAVDPWGPVPGIELMRRLKAELDPRRRLSPGRFVGGI
jgi:glycolate oxidase FAD binding subunit